MVYDLYDLLIDQQEKHPINLILIFSFPPELK